MEENKYYTPAIEEFHVGFEYEFKATYREDTEAFWEKSTIDKNHDFLDRDGYSIADNPFREEDDNHYVICPVEFRVKYLTPEDIQAEGFEMLFEISPSGDTYFKKDKLTIWCDFNRHMVRIHYNDDGNNIVLFQSLGERDIKNKSEFRKILKMIGV
jgi:hypothetical protein